MDVAAAAKLRDGVEMVVELEQLTAGQRDSKAFEFERRGKCVVSRPSLF